MARLFRVFAVRAFAIAFVFGVTGEALLALSVAFVGLWLLLTPV